MYKVIEGLKVKGSNYKINSIYLVIISKTILTIGLKQNNTCSLWALIFFKNATP